MLTPNLKFKNYNNLKLNKNSKKILQEIKKKNWIEKYNLLHSLTPNYKYSYSKKK